MAVRKPVRSTVMVAANGAEIEAAAGELAGRRLDGVRYYTTPQGHDGQAGLGRGRGARGRLRARAGHAGRHDRDHLGAAREFVYGLQLGSGPLLNELARGEFCSVAAQAPWAAVLGKRITKARVHWLDVTWGSREPLARGPDAPVRRQHGHRGRVRLVARAAGTRAPDRRRHRGPVAAWGTFRTRPLSPWRPARPLNPARAQVDEDLRQQAARDAN
jgi:hypothetical protein